jgi:uncharacterized protein YecE (DUF72 family)
MAKAMTDDSNRQLGLFGDQPDSRRSGGRRKTVQLAEAAASLAEVARAVPAGVHLGTSSWSFPGWEGIVYGEKFSESILAKRGLGAYAAHPLFNTVGIDRTYYRPIDVETFAAYANETDPAFRFLVKAHEFLTIPRFPMHPRYGARKGQRNEMFLNAAYARDAVVQPFVEGLKGRGGPLLFQFSPLGVRTETEAQRFAERIHAFLSALPRGPLYAVEVRDTRILGKAYFDAVQSAGAVHCVNVHPSMPEPAAQLRLTTQGTPRALVVRWMLGGSLDFEEARERYRPFNRLVDEAPAIRVEIADAAINATVANVPVYVIANNKAEGSAPLTLAALARAIVDRRGRSAG